VDIAPSSPQPARAALPAAPTAAVERRAGARPVPVSAALTARRITV
jgi:hypothetical protein